MRFYWPREKALRSEIEDLERKVFEIESFERIAAGKLATWVQKHDELLAKYKALMARMKKLHPRMKI